MKEILEEYGGIILAVIGGITILALLVEIFYDPSGQLHDAAQKLLGASLPF